MDFNFLILSIEVFSYPGDQIKVCQPNKKLYWMWSLSLLEIRMAHQKWSQS